MIMVRRRGNRSTKTPSAGPTRLGRTNGKIASPAFALDPVRTFTQTANARNIA